MQYAPTRVRAKFGGFHISAHGYAKNAPDFTLPNRDAPKPARFYTQTVGARHFGAYAFAPLHGYVQNPPGFTPKPSSQDISRRMQYAPTRIRAKFGGFHISPPEYTKNVSDFILSNKGTPKTHLILYPNLRRGYLRGVCFCALHGYVQNLAGFTFPHTDTPKTYPVSPFPIRIHPKPARF